MEKISHAACETLKAMPPNRPRDSPKNTAVFLYIKNLSGSKYII